MSIEQKLAYASACSVVFPCQEECAQDFRQHCPSLWREVGDGVCSAPLQYEGGCSRRVAVAEMSESDKHTWSIRCGARWPCRAANKRNYEDVCPSGWTLQSGKVCAADPKYNGPCEHKAYMSGATAADKKAFETACHVEWPARHGACVHDYAAACPFGWHHDGDECIAPLTYEACSNRKSFSTMTPAAKEDWAKNCKVEFPCQDRDACDKTHAAPCPADWYTFNGGMSCAAPSDYAGACAPVLHGLTDKSAEDKAALEAKCAIRWPCAGEVYSVLEIGSRPTRS